MADVGEQQTTLSQEKQPGKVRKVVIAMDGSEAAKYAFQWYVKNLHKAGDHVILAHAHEMHHHLHSSKWLFSPQHNDHETLAPMMEEERKKVQEKLDNFQKLLDNAKVQGEVKMLDTKKPGEGIVKLSREVEATLIVTGTRGLGTIRRTILGSVSDYILHHAHIPVVICH